VPASGLVSVGRVGKPHGLDGSFFVDGASDAAERFAAGATIYVNGVACRIEGSRQARGRPVIRLDHPAERGAELAVPAAVLPNPEPDAFYVFQLVGLHVQDAEGRELGRVVDVASYPANDVLELDSGLALPLVEACVREVDLDGERIVVAPGFAEPG
jgi:16S rRNA processing protein RimM